MGSVELTLCFSHLTKICIYFSISPNRVHAFYVVIVNIYPNLRQRTGSGPVFNTVLCCNWLSRLVPLSAYPSTRIFIEVLMFTFHHLSHMDRNLIDHATNARSLLYPISFALFIRVTKWQRGYGTAAHSMKCCLKWHKGLDRIRCKNSSKVVNANSAFVSRTVFHFCLYVLLTTRMIFNCIHWCWDKIAAIFADDISNAYLWTKIYDLRLKCHRRFFLRVQLTLSQHWFR